MRSPIATALLAGFGVAALTGVAVLGAATPAEAHSVIVDSTPAVDEVLTDLPDAFSVTANETLLSLGDQGIFQLQIRDVAGAYYGDGCVSVVDDTMSATPALGASGDYVMSWQVVSADGHPVSGEIPFSWDAPNGFEPADGHAAAPVCGEDPGAVPEEPAESGDSTPIAMWIGVGVAVLGGLIAVFAGVTAAARRRTRGSGT